MLGHTIIKNKNIRPIAAKSGDLVLRAAIIMQNKTIKNRCNFVSNEIGVSLLLAIIIGNVKQRI
jgi:hypothetical protein